MGFEKKIEKWPEREPKEKPCPECQARGYVKDKNGKDKKCSRCNGRGFILTKF